MSKKDMGYNELAKALKENRSLVELDLRENEILEQPAFKLFEALEHNYVLSVLKFDIRQKRLPQNFSSYALQAMYEFSMSMEDIMLTFATTED